MYSLIFFVLILFSCCNNSQNKETVLVWKHKYATGIMIPKGLTGAISPDSLQQILGIRLIKDQTHTNVLGDYSITDKGILFEPLIPFLRGMSYEVLLRNKSISRIEIPAADPVNAPALLSVYPAQDTLPENLLKIYLQFSRPMREGESQNYISLVKNNRDTLSDVFLNLQPELWNENRTTLTVWLDPGRIKRDLQPNKRLGNPLKKGNEYKLVISREWKDTEELQLKQDYTKQFFAGLRDSISPDPGKWALIIPQSGTTQTFEADFGEALDYFLSLETIKILGPDSKVVSGKILITNKEHKYQFIPSAKWIAGKYKLQVETRLEDLAGNNINRPFDRDIKNSKSPGTNSLIYRLFQIK